TRESRTRRVSVLSRGFRMRVVLGCVVSAAFGGTMTKKPVMCFVSVAMHVFGPVASLSENANDHCRVSAVTFCHQGTGRPAAIGVAPPATRDDEYWVPSSAIPSSTRSTAVASVALTWPAGVDEAGLVGLVLLQPAIARSIAIGTLHCSTRMNMSDRPGRGAGTRACLRHRPP